MRINHNVASMVAQGSLRTIESGINSSLERLSTGVRIGRASDDAAGLGVSEQMRSQVSGMKMAKRNAQDGVALLQIAEGAANEVEGMLQRMRELAVQATNDTLTSTDRSYISQEYVALQDEIDRVGDATQYNGQTLINGKGFGGSDGSVTATTIHLGPNAESGSDEIAISIDAITTGALGVDTTASEVDDQSNALAAVTEIDEAITSVSTMRSDMGAYVNRLEHAINNLENQEHNTQAAESLIRDVDFASETAKFTRNQIMTQSATSMLSQANSMPQNILS